MAEENPNVLIIERVFDAPRERVFRAWADPEEFSKWYGPNGFTIPVCEMDFRVGGSFHYCMRSENGFEFWLGGVYKEIVPDDIIVFTNYMADEEGNPVSTGKADWPDETIVRVTFEDTQGKTKLTLRHEGMPPSEDRDRAGQGYNQTFDRLAAHLNEG